MLFSAWKVCPEIFQLLRRFGSKSFAEDEGYSGWHLSAHGLDEGADCVVGTASEIDQ